MTKNKQKNIPRWQQGFRPGAYGHVWDAMTPSERRFAFATDIAIALFGVAIIFSVGAYFGGA